MSIWPFATKSRLDAAWNEAEFYAKSCDDLASKLLAANQQIEELKAECEAYAVAAAASRKCLEDMRTSVKSLLSTPDEEL